MLLTEVCVLEDGVHSPCNTHDNFLRQLFNTFFSRAGSIWELHMCLGPKTNSDLGLECSLTSGFFRQPVGYNWLTTRCGSYISAVCSETALLGFVGVNLLGASDVDHDIPHVHQKGPNEQTYSQTKHPPAHPHEGRHLQNTGSRFGSQTSRNWTTCNSAETGCKTGSVFQSARHIPRVFAIFKANWRIFDVLLWIILSARLFSRYFWLIRRSCFEDVRIWEADPLLKSLVQLVEATDHRGKAPWLGLLLPSPFPKANRPDLAFLVRSQGPKK